MFFKKKAVPKKSHDLVIMERNHEVMDLAVKAVEMVTQVPLKLNHSCIEWWDDCPARSIRMRGRLIYPVKSLYGIICFDFSARFRAEFQKHFVPERGEFSTAKLDDVSIGQNWVGSIDFLHTGDELEIVTPESFVALIREKIKQSAQVLL